jgi:hypothetical protein
VEELNSHNIRAIPWWRGYHQGIDWNTFNRERKLKDSVMALPIHQDISESQAVGIGERLLEVVSRTAPK